MGVGGGGGIGGWVRGMGWGGAVWKWQKPGSKDITTVLVA